jgi:hypothetical protein
MPAPPTLLLGLKSPPISGHPSLRQGLIVSLHFNFNFTRVRAYHLPVLHLPFWCIDLIGTLTPYLIDFPKELIDRGRIGICLSCWHDYTVSFWGKYHHRHC